MRPDYSKPPEQMSFFEQVKSLPIYLTQVLLCSTAYLHKLKRLCKAIYRVFFIYFKIRLYLHIVSAVSKGKQLKLLGSEDNLLTEKSACVLWTDHFHRRAPVLVEPVIRMIQNVLLVIYAQRLYKAIRFKREDKAVLVLSNCTLYHGSVEY